MATSAALTALGILAFNAALSPGCLAQAGDPQLPTVVLAERPDLDPKNDYDRCMTINFNDGSGNDTIGLHYIHGEADNMQGELVRGGGSVAVTLDNDLACFTISKPAAKMYMFTVNQTTGETKEPELPPGQRLTYVRPPPSKKSSSSGEGAVETRAASFPAKGFRMKIFVFYDELFAKHFQNRSVATIDKVFNHVFMKFTHSSLGTEIIPVVIRKKEITQEVPVSEANLASFAIYVDKEKLPEADAYVMLTLQLRGSGVSGVAYTGTTCSKRKDRVSIIEYNSNDHITGQNIVHWIGHNLGMSHDFNLIRKWGVEYKTDRRSSKGVLCTNQGGFMDFVKGKRKWSDCSVEDFASYLQANERSCLKTGFLRLPCENTLSKYLCYLIQAANGYCNIDTWRNQCKNSCHVCCSNMESHRTCELISDVCYKERVVRFFCAESCGLCRSGQ